MSLASRNDFFPRIRALHDELWAEHDRMMKRHFEIVDKFWNDFDREMYAEHQRIRNSFHESFNRVHSNSFSSTNHVNSNTTNTTQNREPNQVSVRNGRNELDVFPKVNGNQVSMRMQLPEKIDQSKLCVSNKDGDLVVKLEDKQETPGGGSRSVCYFSQTTMPHNTDFANLKHNFDDKNVLTVTAPLKNE